MDCVAIVGVGLIGGSFGLALRAAGFGGEIVGVSGPRTVEAAAVRGAIDHGETLENAVRRADLVYLSGPIDQILDCLPRLRGLVKPGALVTDAGSTKAAIVEAGRRALPAGAFLGGHPMAGKETSGIAAAERDLFRGRPYLLTPVEPSDLESPSAARFVQWLERIGSRVSTLPAGEHDRLVAQISHLPQIVSTVLAACLERAGISRPDAAGPGICDMTRLALSPHHLWKDIFATNEGEIAAVLRAFASELEEFREALAHQRTEEFFRRAAALAGSIRTHRP